MRRIISVVLTVVMVLSLALMIPANAAGRMVGDIDNDGNRNSADLLLFRRRLIGLYNIDDERYADFNCDGNINAADLLLFRRALIGLFTPPVIDESEKITDYTVVYPAGATVYEKYAAEILCKRISEICGAEISSSDDSAASAGKEILIGNTSRSVSGSAPTLSNNQYAIWRDGDTIALAGKDYMIGGAVAALCGLVSSNATFSPEKISVTAEAADYVPAKADSVILMIGDGMGANHITITNVYARYQSDWPYDYSGFTAAKFPSKGTCTTTSVSDMSSDGTFRSTVTDSAASATALATGWKTQNGKLGINGFGMKVQNVRELAASKGLKTAVVSTEAAVGATPAAFTVHNVSRANHDELLADQTELVESGGITRLVGGLPGEHELLDATKSVLSDISTDSDGFFAMIEEAYIDKSCDRSYGSGYTKTDTAKFVCRFDEAIKYAATFTAARPGTVLIVTADHETGAFSTSGDVTNNGLHTSTPVPVYALGYGTEQFNGAQTDNVKIARFMASVFGADSFGADVTVTQ